MEIVLASNNSHKKKEIAAIFKDLGLDLNIMLLKDLPDMPEIIENGRTFEENAIKKALGVAQHSQKLSLADDSGLVVSALGGRPGIHSARFAGPPQDDTNNITKLLEDLRNVTKKEERKAQFVCAMALAKPHKLINVVVGICDGYIANEKQGTNGFGYDPVFVYPKTDMTFAQISSAQKNKISHRASALLQMKDILKNLLT